LAEANLTMMPEDVTSCVVAGVARARAGRWLEARATIERTLAVLDPQRVDPMLELLYARVLAHTGEPGRAKEIDQRLASRPAGDPIAAAAKADRARLP
jgi:predicted Zn-dependent protease